MNDLNFKTSLDSTEDYTSARINYNKKILVFILGVSFIIEAFYFIASNLKLVNQLSLFSTSISHPYYDIQIYFIPIYIILFILLKFFFHRYPKIIGFLIILFMLAQKIFTYSQDISDTRQLTTWLALVLILAWYYLEPWSFILSVIGSYGYFIIYIFINHYSYDNHYSYTAIMTIGLLASITINRSRSSQSKQEYLQKKQLYKENNENKIRTNIDTLTGLSSKLYFNDFINEKLINHHTSHTFVVIINLDDVKICNNLYNREAGDYYISTFSTFIKLIIRNSDDMVARVSGDMFSCILNSYQSSDEIQSHLDRYNQILKEEFDKKYVDGRFVPHFSYGINKIEDSSQYRIYLQKAEQNMYAQKYFNKKHLNYNNSYLPFVDYLDLFNNSKIAFVVWLWKPGLPSPVAFISENSKQILGYTNEEMMHEDFIYESFIHPEDKQRVLDEVITHINHSSPHFEQTYRFQKSADEYIWVRNYSLPIYKDDKIIQINGHIYDITIEMEAELMMREQYEVYSDIIEASNVGTWQWNISNGEIHCNKRYANILGYTLEEFLPFTLASWQEIIHPDDLEHFNRIINEHINNLRPYYEMECRVKHKNGYYIFVHDRGKIMKRNQDGSPSLLIGTMSDITEMKTTESMLHHSEKLNALGRLAGGIAHDMNNQMMMISSCMDLALTKDTITAYQENIDKANNIIHNISSLLKQLTTFTKHNLYEPRSLDLNVLTTEIVEVIKHTFKKNILINYIHPFESSWIEADKSQLENAMLNLCINAKESIEDNGVITIKLSTEHIETPLETYAGPIEPGPYAKIMITDNGSGIDYKELDKIFEPFYTTKKTGTGVGLASVIGMIRQHHGGIIVNSKLNLGTEFSMYFPIIEHTLDAEMPAEATMTKSESQKQLSILVLDDEEILTEILHEFLELKDCSVISFNNPKEAIAFYQDHFEEIDVSILDMIMPEISGEAVFNKFIEINPKTKALFLSGYSQGVKISPQHHQNILGFMKKPVHMQEVYKQIYEHCHGKN